MGCFLKISGWVQEIRSFFFSHSQMQNWIIGLLTKISEASCPFHKERTPSDWISSFAAAKNEMFCWACFVFSTQNGFVQMAEMHPAVPADLIMLLKLSGSNSNAFLALAQATKQIAQDIPLPTSYELRPAQNPAIECSLQIFAIASLVVFIQGWRCIYSLILSAGQTMHVETVEETIDDASSIMTFQLYLPIIIRMKTICAGSCFYKQQAYSFSLFTKVPKKYRPEQPKSWLYRLFSQNQNSISFTLQKQLFTYLQNTSLIPRQFPFLSNNERFLENSMIVHVCLLKDRLNKERELPRSQLQTFTYNLQTNFFPDYAQFVNSNIPVTNFRQHYSQAYMKKFIIYEQSIKDHEWGMNGALEPTKYGGIFRKIVYENRVGIEDRELQKFCKYYVAHKKYLSMLEWSQLAEWQVKWGFDGLKYIEQIGSYVNGSKTRDESRQSKESRSGQE